MIIRKFAKNVIIFEFRIKMGWLGKEQSEIVGKVKNIW